jgi:hypothetical protein
MGNKHNKVEPKTDANGGDTQVNTYYKENKIIIHNSSELFRQYLHDINNMKILDEEMINNVRNMSNEEKMIIIISLNGVVENIKAFIQ